MGIFDRFRKPKNAVLLPQLCYDVAYFVLPHYAFENLEKVNDLYSNTPTAAGPFFYVMAAQMRKVEPIREDAARFRWHHGNLSDGREYFLLEYPTPLPVDMSGIPVEKMITEAPKLVLARYFSMIIRGSDTKPTEYFILGQAPMGGGTTLRCITPDGMNCNLGPGPVAELSPLLRAVEVRTTAKP